MILNEEFSFTDVRYKISRKIPNDYDAGLSFVGFPRKELLSAGTLLVRLDFPVVAGIFMRVWWMKPEVLHAILRKAEPTASSVRKEWQHQQAMPKAKGVRTQIIEIELTAPVYGWVGRTSPLFQRIGGAEQVFLPNLAKGTGSHRSDYACLKHSYLLPA
jgi:hypothetical protein